jgi:hypothetical protein
VCGEESSTSREKGRVEGSRWGVSSCHDCGLPCANREHLLEILRRASERFGLSGRWPYLDYKDSGLTISRKFEIDLQEGKKRALKRKEERFYLYYYIPVGRTSYNVFGEGDWEHPDRLI